ncbi:MAG: hypothetical protein LBI71_06170 [Enterobacteriaceae bacterium]|jgi:hypothetical protein|nr:hypothetical protein [Enterobacteriaceae bacterium]
MSFTITPLNNSKVDVKNKDINVEIIYKDSSDQLMDGKNLSWTLDKGSQSTAIFYKEKTATNNKGFSQNTLRPLASARVGDKINFTITDITNPAQTVVVGKVVYILSEIILSPLSVPLGSQAYSTFGETANIGVNNYYLELTTTLNYANPDGSKGTPQSNSEIHFYAPPSIQFFSGMTPDTILNNTGGLGIKINTDSNGKVIIYLGATRPGIFDIKALYVDKVFHQTEVFTQVIFLDTEPGGKLPPPILPLNNDVLDLDEYLGKYYPVRLPQRLMTDFKNPDMVFGIIILNNKVVKKGYLGLLTNKVMLEKSDILTTKENSIYYLLTDIDGNGWSSSVQYFSAIVDTQPKPDNNKPHPDKNEPCLFSDTKLMINFINISDITGGLHFNDAGNISQK